MPIATNWGFPNFKVLLCEVQHFWNITFFFDTLDYLKFKLVWCASLYGPTISPFGTHAHTFFKYIYQPNLHAELTRHKSTTRCFFFFFCIIWLSLVIRDNSSSIMLVCPMYDLVLTNTSYWHLRIENHAPPILACWSKVQSPNSTLMHPLRSYLPRLT